MKFTSPELALHLAGPVTTLATCWRITRTCPRLAAMINGATCPYGFRFKDWTDHQALAQSLGVGDGSTKTFQLVKHYASGGVVETRVVAKPVAATVKLYRDGVEATSGWSVDATTGLVTIATAPAAGVQVTAVFAFDVPVRFDSDQIDVTIETYQLGSWGQIPIVELRP